MRKTFLTSDVFPAWVRVEPGLLAFPKHDATSLIFQVPDAIQMNVRARAQPAEKGVQGGRILTEEPVRRSAHLRESSFDQDRRLLIEQRGQSGRVGFVRRGDVITVVNADPEYHALRARGAAFFTLPLVDPGPSHRRLDQAGLVSLSLLFYLTYALLRPERF